MIEHTVTFYPYNRMVKIEKGSLLLKAVSKANIAINNLCGGDGICGRCKMIIKKGNIRGGISEKLTRDEIRSGYVLACMTTVDDDLVVEIPEQTLARAKETADEDANRFADYAKVREETWKKPSALVRKIFLDLQKPTLANNMPDHQRLCAEIRKRLKIQFTQTGLKVIRALPQILRQNDYKVTATIGMRANIAEVMEVEAGNKEDRNFIAVVDMGTTTVVVHLVDAVSGRTLATKACFNSQGNFGREVTSRLIWAEKNGSGEMHRLLVNDINKLIVMLADENKINLRDITAVVCAGNTVMEHFLLELPIENIRRTPYIATSIDSPPLRAAEVGIQINPRGLLFTLPGISAWVGGDLTAGILAVQIRETPDICMLIDIGTNGEIIVGNREWTVAASASAGPALEGAGMECGMRAETGAIEEVFAKGGCIEYKTIGNVSPKGICGSGVIDLLRTLLLQGIIDRSGKITLTNGDRVAIKDGIKRFIIDPKLPLYVTESDIANIITAKAAIYAAIKILMRRLELNFNDIKHFYIAGAFGNYINIENAMQIGLIPPIRRERVEFAGNTSIKGAKLAALHQESFDKLIEIERNTTYYDLMGADDYVEEFKKAMFLPHTNIEEFQCV